MRANELSCKDLMIGDYVRHKKTKDIIKIFEIDNDRAVINNEADGYCSERNISINDIEPVFITPEILEKNGFVGELCSNGIDYVSEEYKLRIICRTNDVGWTIYANHFGLDKKDVFVHELQHALRLCGIEKEIKLEE